MPRKREPGGQGGLGQPGRGAVRGLQLAPRRGTCGRVRLRREGRQPAASGRAVGALHAAASVSERAGPSPLCAHHAAGHQHGPDRGGRGLRRRAPDAVPSGCSPPRPNIARAAPVSISGWSEPPGSTGRPPSKTPSQAAPGNGHSSRRSRAATWPKRQGWPF